MNEQEKQKPLYKSTKARWFHRVRWLIVALAPVLAVSIIANASAASLKHFGDLGLVQPSIAALVALTVVMGMRLSWGRFAGKSRKGATSASSAATAVQLWALCFALLFGAMLLSSLVNRWSGELPGRANTPPKAIETQSRVKAGEAAPTVTSVKVTR